MKCHADLAAALELARGWLADMTPSRSKKGRVSDKLARAFIALHEATRLAESEREALSDLREELHANNLEWEGGQADILAVIDKLLARATEAE